MANSNESKVQLSDLLPMRRHISALQSAALRVLPWLMALGVLLFMFSRVPFASVLEATQRSFGLFVPLALAGQLWIFCADSVATKKIFDWFVVKVGFGEITVARGAAYLLAVLNYAVGQMAIVFFLRRHRTVPVAEASGAVLLSMVTNLIVLFGLASLGAYVVPEPPRLLKHVLQVLGIGLLAYAVVLAICPACLSKIPVISILLRARLQGHLKVILIRLPHVLGLVFYNFVALRTFGVNVPLTEALLMLPVVFFVAVLPISVQGIGTSQAAMVFCFSAYAMGAPEHRHAVVLAAGLASQAFAMLFQVVVGALCMWPRTARWMQAQLESVSQEKLGA